MRREQRKAVVFLNFYVTLGHNKGKLFFLQLIRSMTKSHGCSGLFYRLAVAHLRSHCLIQASILQSRRPLRQAWLWGRYKKGKPIFPKTFFHYRKEVFRLYRNCQWKLFKAVGKHQLLLYFGFLMFAKSSVTGTAWSLHSWFSEERKCMCF